MGKRIELPAQPSGNATEQLQKMYSYLYQVAQTINANLDEIGGTEFTDDEMKIVNKILNPDEKDNGTQEYTYKEAETLKSLIVKTANFVQNSLSEYRLNLLGEYVAEGKFGKYVRKTGLDVEVTPEHIMQKYQLQEIIQGLKVYEINAKNYIKTGLLRTVSSIPVYGVAIGKDIVTFAEDGTETYNDGNKVAELTADALSFWQGGNMIAKYTGNRISFYYGNVEAMYIQNGKIYCTQDMEISSGKSIKIQNWKFSDEGMLFDNGTDPLPFQLARYDDAEALSSGIFTDYDTGSGMAIIRAGCVENVHQSASGYWLGELRTEVVDEADEQISIPRISHAPSYTILFAGTRTRLYPYGMNADIGKPGNNIERIYGKIIYGKRVYTFSSVECDDMILSPRTDNRAFMRISHIRSSLDQQYPWDRIHVDFSGGEGNSNFETRLYGINCIYGQGEYTTPYSHMLDYHNVFIYPHKEHSLGWNFAYEDLGDHRYRIRFDPAISMSVVGDEHIFESNGQDLWEMKRMKSFSGETGVFTDLYYTNLIQSSSRDIKHDIKEMEDCGEKLDQLRPVTFVYDDDAKEKKRAGLIYEDTKEIMPEICTDDESNKAISYVELIPMLLKEIKTLRARVKALEEREAERND